MAIAKVGSSGRSSGAINYVLSENKEQSKRPEILAGSFGTIAEIKQEFEAYNKLNCLVKNQAAHISVSFAVGEKVSRKTKIELAEKLLEKLDFKNVPFIVVEHHDKDYEHFHIIAGRIRDDGSTVKEWQLAERAIQATKELEQSLGLQITEYLKSNDRRVKTKEYKQMERTRELSVLAEAKLTIDAILRENPTVPFFVETMQRSGFDVRPNISEKTGRMSGFSFKKNGIAFKSSAIAKNYSWKNLQKNGLKFEQEKDAKYLIGVKNEFTEKLNYEDGRGRRFEAAKSVVDSAKSSFGRTQSIIDRKESNLSREPFVKFHKDEINNFGFADYNPEIKLSEITNIRTDRCDSSQIVKIQSSDSGITQTEPGRERGGKGTYTQDDPKIGKRTDRAVENDLVQTRNVEYIR